MKLSKQDSSCWPAQILSSRLGLEGTPGQKGFRVIAGLPADTVSLSATRTACLVVAKSSSHGACWWKGVVFLEEELVGWTVYGLSG